MRKAFLPKAARPYVIHVTKWGTHDTLLCNYVCRDLSGFIRDYGDVYSEKEAGVLAQTAAYYHAIELEAGEQPPYKPIYDLSKK
jgi:hypothetical protein